MLNFYEHRRHPLRGVTLDDVKPYSTGLIVAGIVVVGLGFLAFSSIGADFRRYMKIHSM